MESKEEQIQIAFDISENKNKAIVDLEKYDVTSKVQKEAFKRKKEQELLRLKDERGSFVMGRHESIKGLEGKLTTTDRQYFMQLLPFSSGTGTPLKRKGEILTGADLQEILGISSKQRLSQIVKVLSNTTDESSEEGLIVTKRNGKGNAYYLNPYYFAQGKGIVQEGEMFTKVFIPKLNEVIKNIEKLQHRKRFKVHGLKELLEGRKVDVRNSLGLLHVMIPYFHYQTYFLSSEPDKDVSVEGIPLIDIVGSSSQDDSMQYLDAEELKYAVASPNMNRATFRAYIGCLIEAKALARLESGSGERLIIHPDLMCRTDGGSYDIEYDKAIIALYFNGETKRKGLFSTNKDKVVRTVKGR